MLIVETFLQEGMYRRAYGYLQRLKKVLDPLAKQAVAWYESLGLLMSLKDVAESLDNGLH